MHVFLTGASGWVGSAVLRDLLDAGHRVTALVRSSASAHLVAATGAQCVAGSLDDLEILRSHAAAADAVIHTAFHHDFIHYAASVEQDRMAIETLGEALVDSDRPLLVTAGLEEISLHGVATESHLPTQNAVRRSEAAARRLARRGVHAATVRLPPSVHGVGEAGFLPMLIQLARQTGVSAYPGAGTNRWAAVHREDAGRVYRLALETGVTVPVYHAVAERGITLREIAEVIGRRLELPVESRPAAHFGWLARFAAAQLAASAARTRSLLGWQPRGPGLLKDLDQAAYFVD